jgi:hypothetical protein
MAKIKQTYKFIKEQSIVHGLDDEYQLTQEEYYILYNFFVTYSPGEKQSAKKKTFADYGWSGNYERNGLKQLLQNIVDLYDQNHFSFVSENDDENTFKAGCERLNLANGPIQEFSTERASISITPGTNNYLKLFYRIRDGFAHGNFCLKLSEHNERMIIIQDHDKNNVTARIVFKLQTLLRMIAAIDKNHLII